MGLGGGGLSAAHVTFYFRLTIEESGNADRHRDMPKEIFLTVLIRSGAILMKYSVG